jgi:hypothetical protein
MDKITINELKGYLGTGLQMRYLLSDVITLSESQKDEIRTVTLNNDNVVFCLNNCKFLLYPLSSLTEYREDLGFVPMEALCSVEVQEEEDFKIYGTIPEYWKYLLSTKNRNWDNWQVEKLYSWHIDVHGLIDRNLAINLKTLKDE